MPRTFTDYAGIDQPPQQQGNSYTDFLLGALPMAQQQAMARQQPPMPDPMLAAGRHPASPLGMPPQGVPMPGMGQGPPPMPPQQMMPPRQAMPPMPPGRQQMPPQMPQQMSAPPQQQNPQRGAFLAMMRDGINRPR